MELEEMKMLWDEMSVALEKQQRITDSLIIKITQANYKDKVSRILIPETIGALICIISCIVILFNFDKLSTRYLQACGVLTALILVLLSSLSITSVCKIRTLNISDHNYKEILLEYSKSKIQFVFAQKMNFYLGAILMLTLSPVIGQLINGVDLFKETRLWLWYAIGFPFYYFFARWVFKKYVKITTDAGNILKELENCP